MKDAIGVIGIIVLLIILVGLGPLVTLFALNALFQLNIAYTFVNWFAVAWLSALFIPKGSYK